MKRLLLAFCLGLSSVTFAEDAKVDVDGLAFTLPEGWKSVESTSPMRKAQLQVTVAGVADPIDVVFFHFPGGDVEQNITRWKNQLSGTAESKTEEIEAGGKKITIFQGTGTYTDPFAGKGAQENYALIGALIPMDDSGPVVIKAAGPKAAALGLIDALKKLASSPFAKK
ncbi:MAG: hypothetical protein JNM99_12950 [Verrucomicrobiaceae bacterium]|nr:hypothetical protein [Verrucomicrobiaceae bacterium]